MSGRLVVLTTALVAGLLFLGVFAGPADAQLQICSQRGFVTSSGTTACNGTTNPVTVTANIASSATLTLEQVFGSPASSLTVAFGDVDAQCLAAPGPGVTCVLDGSNNFATWYGDLEFSVKLTGVGATNAKLTGLRPAAGTIPSNQLLDGAAGTTPASVYPVSPSTAADLRTGIGAGKTPVTRSLGLRVNNTDASAPWSGNVVYSLVIE